MPPKFAAKLVRLEPADWDALDQIRVRYGLPSAAAAIRYAIRREHERLDATPAPAKPTVRQSSKA